MLIVLDIFKAQTFKFHVKVCAIFALMAWVDYLVVPNYILCKEAVHCDGCNMLFWVFWELEISDDTTSDEHYHQDIIYSVLLPYTSQGWR